jgi:acyl-CoA synthetase (NDP forming)/RimJ/RimL family protein N-acetyltransferase
MTVRYMKRFFEPRSIAVIGASERELSLGGTVLRNLQASGFRGELLAVNPRGDDQVLGVRRFGSVAALPGIPDLAIVCTSPARIPAIVDELGRKQVRAVMIVMGGLSTPVTDGRDLLGHRVEQGRNLLSFHLEDGKTLKEATWEVARAYDMRIMGPNCIGALVPRHRLNASYASELPRDGSVAFVGQSGVLALAILDWARGRDIGFSHVTTLGDSLDVNIADVIEYLADDNRTHSILLHVERLDAGARLVSALRAAARNKLVIAMKSRRLSDAEPRGEETAPALADCDVVYDAVFSRAGVLRVRRSDELFNALESLTRMRRLNGERLAVFCNGPGPALLATDHLVRNGGRLASLGKETVTALQQSLPPVASVGNPVDISAAARPEYFATVVDALSNDPDIDAILAIHVPTLIAPAQETAEAVAAAARRSVKPVLTSWMGDHSARTGRSVLDDAGVPTFDSPEQAVDVFMYMRNHLRNQQSLDQVPRPVAANRSSIDSGAIWALIGSAREAQRDSLDTEESLRVLEAAGIPRHADVDGDSANAGDSIDFAVGITRDPVFGPVLYFGAGEKPGGPFSERQVGLPPLNLNLARIMIESTQACRALAELGLDAARVQDRMEEYLVQLGQLAVEVPVIAELAVYPFTVDRHSLRVGGARVTLGQRRETAIQPYPEELAELVTLPKSGRRVELRPIRAEDAPAHAAFALRLSPQAIRMRFFGPRSTMTQHELAQFTHIDYAREMAFIASEPNPDGESQTLGVVRTWTDPDNISAEFAILIEDSMRGEGLGYLLMQKIIDYTRSRSTLEIRGTVLPENLPMLHLADKLGFRTDYSPEEEAQIVRLPLNEPTDDWQRERLARG